MDEGQVLAEPMFQRNRMAAPFRGETPEKTTTGGKPGRIFAFGLAAMPELTKSIRRSEGWQTGRSARLRRNRNRGASSPKFPVPECPRRSPERDMRNIRLTFPTDCQTLGVNRAQGCSAPGHLVNLEIEAGRAGVPDDQGRDRQALPLRQPRPAATAPRRLHRSLQPRPTGLSVDALPLL
jgi:hypothetical protein